MKKKFSLILIALFTLSVLSVFPVQVRSHETILVSDDFESYTVGVKPSPPWEFWFGQNAEIINSTYVSPSKSLRLLGSTGWACHAVRRFSSNASIIGYEVYGKVDVICGSYASLGASFQKKTSGSTSTWIAGVAFYYDGKIRAGGRFLQSYVLNSWYKIKVLYDRTSRTYDVWIDDILKGSSIPDGYSDPYNIDGFAVSSDWGAVNCYFDNARVFEVSTFPFVCTLDVDPDSLNLASKGKWITGYIEFPEGYNVAEVNISTILLNDTIFAELKPTNIGDYDNDTIPDLMVKFDRAAVIAYITANVNLAQLAKEKTAVVTLTITGRLKDGSAFQGSDTIKIIMTKYLIMPE